VANKDVLEEVLKCEARVFFVWCCARLRVVVKQRSMASGGTDNFEPSFYLAFENAVCDGMSKASSSGRKSVQVFDWT
jgi:hypothetical protein